MCNLEQMRISSSILLEEPRIFERNIESAMYSYANGVVARGSADDIDGKSPMMTTMTMMKIMKMMKVLMITVIAINSRAVNIYRMMANTSCTNLPSCNAIVSGREYIPDVLIDI